jgi:hypothetical protein
MSKTDALRIRVSRLVEANTRKLLVGSQIAFAARTIKAALNGKGSVEGKPDRPA